MIEEITIEQIESCSGGKSLLDHAIDYVVDAAADAVREYIRDLAGPNA